MISTIIVPLDGSPLAECALPFAAMLAQGMQARLLLLRVYSVAPARFALAEPHGASPDLDRSAADDAADYLGPLVERLRADGVAAEACAESAGGREDGHAIVVSSRRRGADLLVMAAHGRGGIGRSVYGSIAEHLLHETDWPVLLIPTPCQRDWTGCTSLRVLIPLGGSAAAEAVVPVVAEFGAAFAVDAVLVGALEPAGDRPATSGPPGSDVRLEAAIADYLESVADRLRRSLRRVDVQVLRGEPMLDLERLAREGQIDLIAMTTHGHGGRSYVTMGRVATWLLQRADQPLLLVRPNLRHPTPPMVRPSRAEAVGATLTGRRSEPHAHRPRRR